MLIQVTEFNANAPRPFPNGCRPFLVTGRKKSLSVHRRRQHTNTLADTRETESGWRSVPGRTRECRKRGRNRSAKRGEAVGKAKGEAWLDLCNGGGRRQFRGGAREGRGT